MHWDWATFGIGIVTGGVIVVVVLFLLFAKGMEDE